MITISKVVIRGLMLEQDHAANHMPVVEVLVALRFRTFTV